MTAAPTRVVGARGLTAGLAMILASGVAFAVAALFAIVRLETLLGTMEGQLRGRVTPLGLVAAGLALVALLTHGARITVGAIVLGSLSAGFAGFAAVTSPTQARFEGVGIPHYAAGGYLLIGAFAIGLTGTVLGLLRLRRPAGPRPEDGRSPLARVSVALSLVAVVVPFLGALPIALSRLAGADATAWADEVGEPRAAGLREARLGLTLGALSLGGWALLELAMLVFVLAGDPIG